jgi:hypothetical protein
MFHFFPRFNHCNPHEKRSLLSHLRAKAARRKRRRRRFRGVFFRSQPAGTTLACWNCSKHARSIVAVTESPISVLSMT